MRAGPIISLVLSTALGIGAVILGRSWLLDDADAESVATPAVVIAAPAVEFQKVAVSRSLVDAGDPLVIENLELVDWPEEFVPEGAMTSLDQFSFADGNLTYARGVIVPGEPIVPEKLSVTPDIRKLAAAVTPGYRAVSIPVTSITGVSGFVLPEDRVDISLTRSAEDPNGEETTFSTTVLQYVRVLASDQNFDVRSEGARVANTVTVEVNQRDANRLATFRTMGELTLSLRSEDDENPPRPRPVTRRSTPSTVRRSGTANIRVIQGDRDEVVTTPVSPSAQPETK